MLSSRDSETQLYSILDNLTLIFSHSDIHRRHQILAFFKSNVYTPATPLPLSILATEMTENEQFSSSDLALNSTFGHP